MIPDYLVFIRFQDKKFIPLLYLITLTLLGFYWKNSGYLFDLSDIWPISIIFSLVLFSLLFDLRAYWAYKCVTGNVNMDFFAGRTTSRVEKIFFQPLIFSAIGCLCFAAFVFVGLSFSSPLYQVAWFALLSPVVIWLTYAAARHSYIKQVGTAAVEKSKYKRLWPYAGFAVMLTIGMNLITVGPLRNSVDFTRTEGFLTAQLMIAMLILCAIVLAINLVFTRLSKRYVFLGRLFLKEIDFYFSSSVPFRWLQRKPLWGRLLLLLMVQTLWIAGIGLLLSLLGWELWFEAYFLICFIPSVAYYYLHVYWLWHDDFMMSCDMYFRWIEIDKQIHYW